MTENPVSPAELGWSPFFQSQLELDEMQALQPVRVMVVHRDRLEIAGDPVRRECGPLHGDGEDAATVGDWLLLDETGRAVRLLDRKSLFRRRAAGKGRDLQLLAANVDTLFIVSSCNEDFNPARLERYLALAHDAGAMPVVVLTKADLAGDEADRFQEEAEHLMPGLLVESVNALDEKSVAPLRLWCGAGQTVALLGSSGVGKSTLVNTLTGSDQATQDIRDDDSKGRHTTTGRSMHRLADGGWLIDTPGMREMQLTDSRDGIGEVFADIEDLMNACRFGDCAHQGEPGCAVAAALADGTLDADRFARYEKLVAEDRRNSESLAASRARSKKLGRFYKSVQSEGRRRKGD